MNDSRDVSRRILLISLLFNSKGSWNLSPFTFFNELTIDTITYITKKGWFVTGFVIYEYGYKTIYNIYVNREV